MIEYALLFALGFLAATLVGLLIAPAVQRRIVSFTEKRMKATAPLSPQEVRAQKDMARAAYAAENARISQSLMREREKVTHLRVGEEVLRKELGKLAAERQELEAQIADMSVEAGDYRSTIRQEQQRREQIKTLLDASEKEVRNRDDAIRSLNTRYDRLLTEMDDLRIDLAARHTEIENLHSQLRSMRDDRDRLREETKRNHAALKETQAKLSREEGRVRQIETKLMREIAGSADKDNVIERRIAEVNRLRDKLKGIKPGVHAARAEEPPTDVSHLRLGGRKNKATTREEPVPALDPAALEEKLRYSSAAVSEQLAAAASAAEDDEALRDRIADIAADMVVLTMARAPDDEACAVPLGDDAGGSGRKSLARRIRDRLPAQS
ncbi:hypothetical protein LXM94_00100 [Rhizobium sp. TRM95111]|uniref:hypothetical protein n=1 Tax=Rhizobium alarense TaxID=2846851 RepID=UPI001F32340C|nr:hypothetical protein [Rhizobium alarense]MCF3638370.1 hypothetical protein [Rhizobium alarense]